MRKHGLENFTIETLGEAEDWRSLDQLEVAYISKLDTVRPGGYNISRGGSSITEERLESRRLSREEINRAISDTKFSRARITSAETKRTISAIHRTHEYQGVKYTITDVYKLFGGNMALSKIHKLMKSGWTIERLLNEVTPGGSIPVKRHRLEQAKACAARGLRGSGE